MLAKGDTQNLMIIHDQNLHQAPRLINENGFSLSHPCHAAVNLKAGTTTGARLLSSSHPLYHSSIVED
jgi:hypothetical protein